MRLVTILAAFLVLSACSHTPNVTNEISDVQAKPLKTLVYESHELPTPYQSLIKTPGNIEAITAAYEKAQDEYVRFSFAVVMYEKSTQNLTAEEASAAQGFFTKALKDEFDWVKQTAVWGLSRVGTLGNFASLLKTMEEDEGWLEDDVHEALALIRDRSLDKRKPASEADGVSYHDSTYWKNWWSKNQ